MRNTLKYFLTVLMAAACSLFADAQTTGEGGYLFAHTGVGAGKYYRLYYAVSRDGMTWKALNGGEQPLSEYFGFPYITQDDKGTFYLLGTTEGERPHSPAIWRSQDLVHWEKTVLDASIMALPEHYENDTNSYGAMKIFFDPVSNKFMITWHASLKRYTKGKNHWKSMRTFYILTEDFKTFTKAQQLFDFDGPDKTMAQIDASIHYYNGIYYAVIKDERWKDNISTEVEEQKVIRIARSKSLTGPYTNPGCGITPEWREAPTLVKSIDGSRFHLYVEDYGKHRYELYTSESIERHGVWEKVETMTPPENCRHGCIIRINEHMYNNLINSYETN